MTENNDSTNSENEKRFKEIISTQKIIDTVTNKEYDCLLDNDLFDLINELAEENEYLKIRFKEERELAMKISRECDALTIKKQELELEIIRLEKIIRTGDDNDCNSTS